MLALLARNLALLIAIWIPISCVEQPGNYSADDSPRFEPVPVIKPGGQVVALALGGGGTRVFAAIGVLKALEAKGYVPDLIVGTSGGAIIGALYAAGFTPDEIEEIALDTSILELLDVAISDYGYIAGNVLRAKLTRLLEGKAIEALKKPFAAVVTHVETGGMEILNRGNAALAVRASMAIPGVFLPVIIDGAHYVDGEIVAPVPIRVAKQLGADVVIAIDVQARLDEAPAMPFYPSESLSLGALKRRLIDAEVDDTTILVQPVLAYSLGYSNDHKRRMIAAGEASITEALPKLQQMIQPEDQKTRKAQRGHGSFALRRTPSLSL
jgi:NTE family protein